MIQCVEYELTRNGPTGVDHEIISVTFHYCGVARIWESKVVAGQSLYVQQGQSERLLGWRIDGSVTVPPPFDSPHLELPWETGTTLLLERSLLRITTFLTCTRRKQGLTRLLFGRNRLYQPRE